MTRKKNRIQNEETNATPPSGVMATVLNVAKDMRTKIAVGVVAFITGGIVVYFTGMLPDYGQFDVAEKHVTYPAKVEIDPMIEPKYFWPLHRTRIVTEGFGDMLRPVGDTELVLPIIKERTPLSKILRPFSFEPTGPGTTDLKLRLRSSSGREIAQAAIRVIVQRHVDYDGEWKMKIGPRNGTAYLRLAPNTDPNAEDAEVYGYFAGDDHTTGLITGNFNGDKFVGHATFGDMPARWHLNADTRREGAGLIAQGTSEMFTPTPEGWSPVAGTSDSFSMQWLRPVR